jgi:predicted phosphate transport protein (TIGR00153 family)
MIRPGAHLARKAVSPERGYRFFMRTGGGHDAFQREVDDAVHMLFSLVAEAVGWATESLLSQETDRAREVIADDEAFDERCNRLSGLIKERLARGVAATELEDLVAVLQIIPELERSADLAKNIAQRATKSIGGLISPRSRGLIDNMGSTVTEMWRDAATAYRHRSRDAAIELRDADDALDELAARLVQEAVDSQAEPQTAIDLGLLARYYERLGDHAVNLARRVEFMSKARRFSAPRLHLGRANSDSDETPRSRTQRVLRNLARFRLSPTDDAFFELFRAASENCLEAARTFRVLTDTLGNDASLFDQIKGNERRGDELTTELLTRLDQSFVTPLDREDIHELGDKLDDVVDAILSAASLMDLNPDDSPPPELNESADTLVAMATELDSLIRCLPSGNGARLHIERIEHLERQGDAIFRRGMGKLLSGAYEPLTVIAWKDIIQSIEESLNSIEDAGDVIEGILVKSS